MPAIAYSKIPRIHTEMVVMFVSVIWKKNSVPIIRDTNNDKMMIVNIETKYAWSICFIEKSPLMRIFS